MVDFTCAGQNRQAIFPEGVCGARADFLPTGAVQVVAICFLSVAKYQATFSSPHESAPRFLLAHKNKN